MGAQKVLLVGHEKHLVQRLIDRNCRVDVWSTKKLPKLSRQLVSTHYHQPYSELPKFDGPPPDFVIAANEAAVTPAALLRASLGLGGDSVEVAQRVRNKKAMKQWALQAQLPQARFIPDSDQYALSELVSQLGLPLVFKREETSGSRGLIITERPQVLENLDRTGLIAEQYLDAQEVSVESFFFEGSLLWSNITEYVVKSHVNLMPAQLEASLTKTILALNEKVLRHFGAYSGMSHIEFFIKDNRVLFGEVAFRPPGGYLMELIEESYGFDPWLAYIDVHMNRLPTLYTAAEAVSSAVIFHPGEGVLTHRGEFDRLSKLSECVYSHFKASIGDHIEKREGLGQNIGYLILKSHDRARLLDCMNLDQGTQTLAV
jgi:hypothetical protein